MSREVNGGELIRLAVCSDLRKSILISMKDGKKSLGDFRDELKISSTTAIHALRDLEKNNLTFQDKDRNYLLTDIGKIITLKLIDFADASEVLKKHEIFWLNHDLSGIPENLMEKIGWLRDSEIVKAESTDIFMVYSTFVELLKDAKEIRSVSSIFAPVYTLVLKDVVLNKKVDTKFVVNEEVWNKIDQDILKEIYNNKSLKFELYRMKQDVKLAFTVTDRFLSFGLFDHHGIYDWNNDLISHNEKARAWGYELFDFCVQKSERIL